MLCSYTAGFRNFFCYADILTMAAIALTRSVGLIRGAAWAKRRPQLSARRSVLPTGRIVFVVLLIWVLSFAIISPAIFQLDIGSFNFGQFGWDVEKGKCDLIFCKREGDLNGSVMIYLFGVFVPLFIIIGSHASLGFFMTREVKKISYGLGLAQITPIVMKVSRLNMGKTINSKYLERSNFSTINPARMNTLLVTLIVCYVVFTIPLVVVELLGLEAFYSMLLYSWHWWMYAINFFIYVATSKDFRSVYQLFLSDILESGRNIVRRHQEKAQPKELAKEEEEEDNVPFHL